MNSLPTNKNTLPSASLHGSHYFSIAVIMGLMGAFFWAIRGTSGYGGSQGGLLAGLGWAVLWYYFANLDGNGKHRPYASPRILAALTFGIAFGGMTGYGVYIAWLQGKFYLNYPDGVRAIAPWTGYVMLFFCGLHWGGITGAFTAWCAPKSPLSRKDWFIRIVFGIIGAVAAGVLVRALPAWFLPFYEEGIYTSDNPTCIRAEGSIRNNAPHVGLFIGFLLYEILRRDWRSTGIMLVMALGFAIPFSVGGYWQTMHGTGLGIDWWKNWEMSIGLGGGLSLGLAFYLFNRPSDKQTSPPVSLKECVWGGGFPLWLAGGLTFANAYKGFVDIHQLQWPTGVRMAVSLAYIIPTALLFFWWTKEAGQDEKERYIPSASLLYTLVLIILAGYVVSIPVPLQLANKVLLALYTLYISVSLIQFFLMQTCRNSCQVGR